NPLRFTSPKRLSEAGEDLLGVELQEARLVGARGVEDEVTETETDIEADALDLLVRVARHDPAAGGAIERQRVGEPLHLHRVFDAACGPEAGTQIGTFCWGLS